MRQALPSLIAMAACSGICCAETIIPAEIESVGLFKNGHAVIRRVIELPGPGVYTVTEVPEAVHGTLWIESDAVVNVRMTQRAMAVPLDHTAGLNVQQDLVGRTVVVRLRDSDRDVNGRVAAIHGPAAEEFSRQFEQDRQLFYWSGGGYGWNQRGAGRNTPDQFLILETSTGMAYIDRDEIAMIRVDNAADHTVHRRVPVLELHAGDRSDGSEGPSTVVMTYLAKGITWSPSYRINLDDTSSMTLLQQAVIRNELEDFENAEVVLISGFPNIQFGHVTSPLSPDTTLASFFQQLSRRIGGGTHFVMSQAVMTNIASGDQSFADEEEHLAVHSDDLHYHSVGRFTMNRGDALMIEVARGSTDYQRVVQWTIPVEQRNQYNRHHNNAQHEQDEGAWDSIRFRNPWDFPMTTAPATVTEGGHFRGQRMAFWTNPMEEVTVPVSRALSVQTSVSEYRGKHIGTEFHIHGARYVRVEMRGEIDAVNRRSEPINMIIRRHFEGEVIEVGEDAELLPRRGSARQFNVPREIVWNITLEPGEQRQLSYTYSTVVPR